MYVCYVIEGIICNIYIYKIFKSQSNKIFFFFLNDIDSLIHTLAEHSMQHININTKTLTR